MLRADSCNASGDVAGWGCSWRALLRWLSDLRDSYGAELLVTIFCSHHLLKGFVGGGGMSGLVGSAMDFSYRSLGATGPELQVYSSCALLPWSMKSLMGLMSDGFPLLGYRKASYLLAFGVLAVCAYVLLAWLGGTGPQASLPLLTGLLFVAFFQMALADLLVEGKYSEKVKAMPARGPDLITFVWGGMAAAGLCASTVSGVLIGRFGPAACYLLAAPFAAAIVWPAARNYLEERRGPGCCSPDLDKWRGKGFVPFVLAIVMGAAGICLALVSVYASSLRQKFFAAMSVGLLNLVLFSTFLRPSIARINAFFFLQNVFHVGTHGASFYFFTDTEVQFPNGPHLTAFFYVTVIGTVGSLFNLLGMLCYNAFLKQWRYRSVLVMGSLTHSAVQCISAIVYLRWNLQVYIPDPLFMVASSATQHAISQLSWMPMTVMLAQLVPEGLESTLYALLAGSLNLGGAVASYAGAFLLQQLGVNPSGQDAEGHQFENLWVAALISALGPCVPLVLVGWLIPDARQTEKLLTDGDPSSATVGSLFQRWLGSGYSEFREDDEIRDERDDAVLKSSSGEKPHSEGAEMIGFSQRDR